MLTHHPSSHVLLPPLQRSTGDYEAPSLARSPEVHHVLSALSRHGCDLFMDLHGDEKLPHNFLSGSEGVPKWQQSPRLGDLQAAFLQALMEVRSLLTSLHCTVCVCVWGGVILFTLFVRLLRCCFFASPLTC